ncbi:MAG: DNA recombination protein RmuC, partial [Frankiaceae bacterium]|nr:DNA recombination protein RmuC [Frankiaceae bacterium]
MPVAIALLIGTLGAALGALIGALRARLRSAARLGELSARLEGAQTALAEAGRLGEAQRAEFAAARAELVQQRAALIAERAQLEGEARSAQGDAARLEAMLESERAAAGDRAALLARADEQLREAFGALSAEALRHNNEAFAQLAESRLGQERVAAAGDLAARQQAIDAIVAPLRETLTRVQAQLGEAERSRAGSRAALAEQIGAMRVASEQLRTETAQLVTALRAPQVRGRWGELQLERALETAGMVEHVDYVTQATSSTEEGSLRPDAVVRLPGG